MIRQCYKKLGFIYDQNATLCANKYMQPDFSKLIKSAYKPSEGGIWLSQLTPNYSPNPFDSFIKWSVCLISGYC